MKKVKILIVLFFLFGLYFSHAQSPIMKEETLEKGSIGEQFDYIMRKSSNYQNYEVVKRIWLQKLKSHVIDSLKQVKKDLIKANGQISKYQDKIKNLETGLKDVNAELKNVKEAKDSISFFGASLKKGLYKAIVWSIILLLLAALSYFVYSFKKSNEITQTTLTKYNELEDEYNASRTRALEREQALNRKLLDAVNKQKS